MTQILVWLIRLGVGFVLLEVWHQAHWSVALCITWMMLRGWMEYAIQQRQRKLANKIVAAMLEEDKQGKEGE